MPVTNGTIHYILCSNNFDDVVVIHLENINKCIINNDYVVPSKKEIRNAYFKHSKKSLKVETDNSNTSNGKTL